MSKKQLAITAEAIQGITPKSAKKGSKGSLDLIQQMGINANNHKSIGGAFYFLCYSLCWYIVCKFRGDIYTAISNFENIKDKPTRDALTQILNLVVKPTLNEYSIENGMPTKESKAGNIYPLMNQGLAKPIFKCLGKDYMTKGKDSKHVFEKPNGNLPSDLADMIAESFNETFDALELDVNDL